MPVTSSSVPGDGGSGGVKADGLHTQPSGMERLTTLLPVDAQALDNLSAAELKAVQVARLSFAQDVCTRAALAYQQILAVVEAS